MFQYIPEQLPDIHWSLSLSYVENFVPTLLIEFTTVPWYNPDNSTMQKKLVNVN